MQLTKSGLNVPNDNKVASKDSCTWLVVTTNISVYCLLVYDIAPFFDIILLIIYLFLSYIFPVLISANHIQQILLFLDQQFFVILLTIYNLLFALFSP